MSPPGGHLELPTARWASGWATPLQSRITVGAEGEPVRAFEGPARGGLGGSRTPKIYNVGSSHSTIIVMKTLGRNLTE